MRVLSRPPSEESRHPGGHRSLSGGLRQGPRSHISQGLSPPCAARRYPGFIARLQARPSQNLPKDCCVSGINPEHNSTRVLRTQLTLPPMNPGRFRKQAVGRRLWKVSKCGFQGRNHRAVAGRIFLCDGKQLPTLALLPRRVLDPSSPPRIFLASGTDGAHRRSPPRLDQVGVSRSA